MNAEIEIICTNSYKIPKDPYNKLAISVNYYITSQFTSENYYFLRNGDKWGTQIEYKELIENFNALKSYYVEKGIPVIIVEVGVLTEVTKEISSIREYLNAVFILSNEYEGIMACLWDTSNKEKGNMNFYNRETDEWYDEKIKNIFYKISRKTNIKSSEATSRSLGKLIPLDITVSLRNNAIHELNPRGLLYLS